MDTGTERLIASVEDGVGWIVFNNTDKHNAMTADMLDGLARACDGFGRDPAVRAVVLRGAGERAFISGADIGQLDSGELGRAGPAGVENADARATGGLTAIEKPVLAMIHGYCLGGGMAMALAADIRLCADDAQFGIPAARLGVGYPYEATARLVALVGPGNAAEILFAGARLDGAEAARIGLANHCLPKGELEGAVRSLAMTIADNAPLSHVAHKRAIRAAAIGGPPGDRPAITAAITAAWQSDDFAEGRRAFLDRRPPRFVGR
jgi:enoyl-CoA hydratase/carnithine racemase